jgi:hypothetical protein
MNEEIEIWKDVPEYEGFYQVSNLGRVKSLIKHNGTNERILCPSNNGKNYLQITFNINYKPKCFKVHVLVAMAFLGHKPDGTQKVVIDHKDNNRLNNRVDNLNLTTQRENSSKDKKGGTSEFTGVHWDKNKNKWGARIRFKKSCINLGVYDLELDAAKAYQKALGELNAGLDLDILYPKMVKSSQYAGVCFSKNKWIAQIIFNNTHIFLGYFNLEIDAANAYQKARLEADQGFDLNVLYPKKVYQNKHKWIYFNKQRNKWDVKYKGKFIGRYETEDDAYKALQNYIASLVVST